MYAIAAAPTDNPCDVRCRTSCRAGNYYRLLTCGLGCGRRLSLPSLLAVPAPLPARQTATPFPCFRRPPSSVCANALPMLRASDSGASYSVAPLVARNLPRFSLRRASHAFRLSGVCAPCGRARPAAHFLATLAVRANFRRSGLLSHFRSPRGRKTKNNHRNGLGLKKIHRHSEMPTY